MNLLERYIRFCLENKLVALLGMLFLIGWGVVVSPFDWDIDFIERRPVPVDAIPDTGDNQQIVFTEWSGRSPQDIEDQITYPLTTALLGLPGVKTIRSSSTFGFSSIYVIFKEDVDFYWSRSRILEKLSSLPRNTLPADTQPRLGPDATALGQVFWYTLEGRDSEGNAAGGWDLEELRSVQDWYVRYALQSVEGVAEVASVGGFVKEYQVDVDPDALRVYGVSIRDVFRAVKNSNIDVGARTIEVNSVEYVIRGLGFIENLDDLRKAVVTQRDNVPVTLDQLAEIEYGPAMRRGALDKGGAEAVGGVVVARFGENPLAVIQRVKQQIEKIDDGMPSKTLEDGRESKVTIVPFYDRSGLIKETLGTLETAVRQQILVTIIVVLLMVVRLRSALIISSVLPLAVLSAFIGMSLFGVDANIVALSGIAIAIGTIVDMAVVLVENTLRHLDTAPEGESRLETIFKACSEVGGAVLTAVLTTVVSFLPVFQMVAEEGRMFRPLAYTKTFALIGSILVALSLIPALLHLFGGKGKVVKQNKLRLGLVNLSWREIACGLVALTVGVFLAMDWEPFGPESLVLNIVFVVVVIGGLILACKIIEWTYESVLAWVLRNKTVFLLSCCLIVVAGGWSWKQMGREFMPSLDEGSFLFMPSTMSHASIGEAMDVLQMQDRAISSIPEVETVVGKLGRVDSSLDPAPISMIETIVTYKDEYAEDENGNLYRQWRDEIETVDDIWNEIVRVAQVPGTTSAPKLQPIETRSIMLQSGMRSPMGLKVFGPDLESIEKASLDIERLLKTAPSVKSDTVFAERVVGKPYLEIEIDRDAIARYGISVRSVQDVIEIAVGGKSAMQTVEGRARYSVRVRYQRERRDSFESIENILVATPNGTQIPLKQLANFGYKRGPQVIKSENTFQLAYVLFDKIEGPAEVEVVEELTALLEAQKASGELVLPTGVSYEFAGTYQSQQRAASTLRLVLPIALALIWLLLYFQFKRVSTTLIVFSGIAFAWAGGFILLWCYGQSWFMNMDLFGMNARELFHVGNINLSVAVWVGFLALFGIATDNGVIVCTYLQQVFKEKYPRTKSEIRAATIEAGVRRVRPAVMTSATTILALLPVLTSSGRGADVMVPMAIPTFGGMLLAMLTIFVVPALYCGFEELTVKFKKQ